MLQPQELQPQPQGLQPQFWQPQPQLPVPRTEPLQQGLQQELLTKSGKIIPLTLDEQKLQAIRSPPKKYRGSNGSHDILCHNSPVGHCQSSNRSAS